MGGSASKLDEARKNVRLAPDDASLDRALLTLQRECVTSGELQEASSTLDQLIELRSKGLETTTVDKNTAKDPAKIEKLLRLARAMAVAGNVLRLRLVTVSALPSLGGGLKQKTDILAKAENLILRSLDVRKNVFERTNKPEHELLAAESYSYLAMLQNVYGHYDEANVHHLESLRIYARRRAAERPREPSEAKEEEPAPSEMREIDSAVLAAATKKRTSISRAALLQLLSESTPSPTAAKGQSFAKETKTAAIERRSSVRKVHAAVAEEQRAHERWRLVLQVPRTKRKRRRSSMRYSHVADVIDLTTPNVGADRETPRPTLMVGCGVPSASAMKALERKGTTFVSIGDPKAHKRFLSKKTASFSYDASNRAWSVTDLRGTSGRGVLYNGVRVREAVLSEGDVVAFGTPGASKLKMGAHLKKRPEDELFVYKVEKVVDLPTEFVDLEVFSSDDVGADEPSKEGKDPVEEHAYSHFHLLCVSAQLSLSLAGDAGAESVSRAESQELFRRAIEERVHFSRWSAFISAELARKRLGF